MISALDAPDSYLVDVWLIFYEHPPERRLSRFWKLLEPGFSHVEAWREDRGAWVRVDPCLEFMNVEVHLGPPWELMPNARFVHVVRLVPLRKLREPFMVGPITCVELSKALIGIRAPLIRTPFALYNYLRKSECSSSVWGSSAARLLLWRLRKLPNTLRSLTRSFVRSWRICVAAQKVTARPFLVSDSRSERLRDEITLEAEGVAGTGCPARTPGRATVGPGRTAEHEAEADAERLARDADVPELSGVARPAVEHVRPTDVCTAR